ncbi:MAG: 2-hydroxychromene-2-carboxylate isomerase [Mariprofundaceae bacterium]
MIKTASKAGFLKNIEQLRLDFYYDFISPYSYLAAMKLPILAEKYGVSVNWVPMNLPKVIQQSGNLPPGTIPKKALYLLRDLKRWASWLDLPLKVIKPGAFDSRPALYIACMLNGGMREKFSFQLFQHLWSGDIDPRKKEWLPHFIEVCSLPTSWLAYDHDAAVNQLLENTDLALKTGIFGAPTFILHTTGRPEMFFGVDRMDFLERALAEAVV